MKIQILEDRRFLNKNESDNVYEKLKELIDVEIVDELKYEEADYFLVFDHYDLDFLDKRTLAKTILLHIPSPSVKERLSKYKVAGVVESRLYFNNFPLMFGLEKIIEFNVFEDAIFNYGKEYGYISFIKKEREEDYVLANVIVDYLKMHQRYFLENKNEV